MLKKILVLFVILFMFASAAAGAFMMFSQMHQESTAETAQPTPADQTQEVRAVLVSYFKDLKAGQIESAYKLVLPGAADDLQLLQTSEEARTALAEIENETVREAAQEYQTLIFSSNVREYEIRSIEITDSSATAYVIVTAADSQAIPELDDQTVQDYMDQYIDEHEEELTEMLYSQGEEATQEYLMERSALYSYKKMKKNVQNTGSVQVQLVINLVKKDGSWYISEIRNGGLLNS